MTNVNALIEEMAKAEVEPGSPIGGKTMKIRLMAISLTALLLAVVALAALEWSENDQDPRVLDGILPSVSEAR